MDFELSAEQRLCRDTVRAFADDEIRPVAQAMEASEEYPEQIVAKMRQMGLFGLTVPEEFGGTAADLVSYALAFEEISRAWMGVAGILGRHSLSRAVIARYRTPPPQRGYPPQPASRAPKTGNAPPAPALGADPHGIAT